MKKLLQFCLLIFFFGGFSIAHSEQEDRPACARLEFRGQEFDMVAFDLKDYDVRMFWKDSDGSLYGSLGNLKAQLNKDGKKLIFATNGGMYLPDQSPQGLYVEKGKVMKSLDTVQKGYGNFYMAPNGVFSIGKKTFGISTTKDFELKDEVYATQSGPMLLVDGKIHPAFREGSRNKYIRSGAGLVNDRLAVFAISRAPCNFYDFASLFKEFFGCNDALYLDGAISKAYVPCIERYDGGGNFGVIIGVLPKG